ncbi:hypothetical protein QM012_002589 [Aureobasidium pullulans]|uniref:Uncharacterized protein n=1 Tax=Aureobasidium pullulans TaxID=5580 RepID=A0ABR0TA13_AURPU
MAIPSLFTVTHRPSKQAPLMTQEAFDHSRSEFHANARFSLYMKHLLSRIIRARLLVIFAAILAVKTKLLDDAEESKGSGGFD